MKSKLDTFRFTGLDVCSWRNNHGGRSKKRHGHLAPCCFTPFTWTLSQHRRSSFTTCTIGLMQGKQCPPHHSRFIPFITESRKMSLLQNSNKIYGQWGVDSFVRVCKQKLCKEKNEWMVFLHRKIEATDSAHVLYTCYTQVQIWLSSGRKTKPSRMNFSQNVQVV